MDDFERRRELRRQKREEMRLEAERLSYQRNDDDDEEAARERRRRARQERLRQKEEGDLSGEVTEKSEVNAQNSVAGEESKRSTDDEAALLERLARREERRQKRLQEALERQKEFDPTITDGSLSLPSRREVNNVEENETTGKEEKAETRGGHCEIEETETVTKSYQRNNWRQDGEEQKKEEKDKEEVKDDKDKGKAPKEEMKSVWDQKKGVPEQKTQNGERELTAPKLKPTENAFGRSNLRGTANAEESKPEALKRLEDQRRRRGENDSEELEKLKEKQQEAAAELDELKKRREERRKILEEEEQKKKQEEAERKVREEEEKKRMKEEIERRRAEAAEKRQKIPEDGVSEDKKPFKCFSPKGSSLKIYFVILFTIEERTEFLNKSAQKSGMKPTQTTAVVSKIDSRLEQYTSAIEGTKASRPAKPAASDLHVPAEGVRNIKSMWEKGNFSSPSGTGTPNKETAGLKVGVSSRINEWLTKTPESNKSPAPKPSDLKPGDVSGKRNLWEKQSVEKPPSSSKVSAMGKKSEANAGLRQLEKEP
ncbi:caldesmon isoform X7 [Pseudopipra pipra]|uniref:caldesmon isoform X7 n=1 Tax=Pseudopipra pipra TaxID=415032 RepID=UPI0031394682